VSPHPPDDKGNRASHPGALATFPPVTDPAGVTDPSVTDPSVTDPSGAWRNFCERLARLGDAIVAADWPSDPATQAEGIRHLSRLTVMAAQSYLEFADADFPVFHRYDDDAVKWGGPNADNQYLRARVDPAGCYRIVGDTSAVRDLIVSTHEGDMQLGQYGVFAERRLDELRRDPDGRIELILGGPDAVHESDVDHIPLDPAATIVMIRVYVADWMADGLPWFDIERIDRASPLPAPLRPETLVGALDAAATWVERSVVYWRDYLEASPVRRLVNRLSPPRSAAGGSERIRYGAGWWQLAAGEALAIEFPSPTVDPRADNRTDYWSFQLYSTPWFESLDVRNRVNSLNHRTALVDPDGVVRIAVAPTDPGITNWLDTEGRTAGMVSYRFVGAHDPPTPTCQLVRVDDLWPQSARCTPIERGDQIAARRRGIARRFHR
jgi:hypothetical protein